MLKTLRYPFLAFTMVLTVMFVWQPNVAKAKDPDPATSGFVFDPTFTNTAGTVTNLKNETGIGAQDPAYIVFTVINTALIFLGTITIVMIIVAGFMWIFAAGTEEKITKAKDLLKGAIFGLVIVLGSYGLAQFVFAAIRLATTGKP